MKLQSIESHTIDMDELPLYPVVLDVGSRGFAFSRGIFKYRPKALIVAMDPDPKLQEEIPPGVLFLREALVGDERTVSAYADFSTGEGNFLCSEVPHYAQASMVPCVNLRDLMKRLDIQFWSVVKLDCEGSEFGILETWPGPIAKQISVEFHDWTGPEKIKATPQYYERLFAGPLRDYDVLSHELTTVGPGPAWGHWDSVFRLKEGTLGDIR